MIKFTGVSKEYIIPDSKSSKIKKLLWKPTKKILAIDDISFNIEKGEAIGLVGNFGSHTLRKTFAYHAYQYTHDIRAVNRLFRHSAISVTKVYIEQDEGAEVAFNRSDDEVYSSLNL